MTDSSRQTLRRIAGRVPVPQPAYDRLLRRRNRKRRNQRIAAGTLALALVALGFGATLSVLRDERSGRGGSVPAVRPDEGPCFFGDPCFDTDIYRIRMDGTELTRLGARPERDIAYSISPDGRIAFHRVDGDSPQTSSADVYTMAFDGSDVRRLTDDPAIDGFPSWSPDGTQIAFASERAGKQEIYVMNADGTEQMRLLHIDDDLDESHPTWSPDGEQIAFVRAIIPPGTAGGLWVMDSDGSNPHLLLGAPLVVFPRWSPDGTRIAFQHEIGGEVRVGVLEVATGEVTDLGPGWFPSWSPDSSRLAYSGPEDGIFIVALAQPTERLLVHRTGGAPIWSADGEWIVFNDQGSTAARE
ncbi:MAG: TolB family protein [Actinomycetota bacterium]